MFFALAAALLAVQAAGAGDLKSVLESLDAAAKDFHSTSAHVEFDTIQTEPIPDKDVLTGTAYYQRTGNRFQMAAHLTERNNRPTAMTYIFSGGVLGSRIPARKATPRPTRSNSRPRREAQR